MTAADLVKKLVNILESAEKKQKLKMIIDGSDFVLFFRYKGDVYGANEQGRLVFAKMKDKDDPDTTDGWRESAGFTASKICELADGKGNQVVFGMKELDGIEVITDKDKVEKMCLK